MHDVIVKEPSWCNHNNNDRKMPERTVEFGAERRYAIAYDLGKKDAVAALKKLRIPKRLKVFADILVKKKE